MSFPEQVLKISQLQVRLYFELCNQFYSTKLIFFLVLKKKAPLITSFFLNSELEKSLGQTWSQTPVYVGRWNTHQKSYSCNNKSFFVGQEVLRRVFIKWWRPNTSLCCHTPNGKSSYNPTTIPINRRRLRRRRRRRSHEHRRRFCGMGFNHNRNIHDSTFITILIS